MSKAGAIKDLLRAEIELASLFPCRIGRLSAEYEWIRWEIETAKPYSSRLALVGVQLARRYPWPEPLPESGAVFTPREGSAAFRAHRSAKAPPHDDGYFRDRSALPRNHEAPAPSVRTQRGIHGLGDAA